MHGKLQIANVWQSCDQREVCLDEFQLLNPPFAFAEASKGPSRARPLEFGDILIEGSAHVVEV